VKHHFKKIISVTKRLAKVTPIQIFGTTCKIYYSHHNVVT